MHTVRPIAALVLGLFLAAPAVLCAQSSGSQGRPEAKLLRVAPGESVEVSLDPRAHGAVAAVRVVPLDRRSPVPRSLQAEIVMSRSRSPALRISAGRDAAPGGPYGLEGQTRDRRSIDLPFAVEIVAAERAEPSRNSRAPAARREAVGPSREVRPTPEPSAEASRGRTRGPERSPIVRRGVPAPASSPPSGRALLILLENGGLRSSLAAIGSELPSMPGVPYLVYPKGAGPDEQVKFLMRKNESIAQAVARLSDEIAALSQDPGSDLFAQAHESACNLLPTSATRISAGTCRPRQDCFALTPGNPACNALPTTAPCPEAETYDPRQECLDHPPSTPTLQAAMLDPANWGRRTQDFEDWLDTTSDFLIEEIAKVARHQSAFSTRYDRVVVLEDHQVKPQTAIATIQELSQDHVVDVHVLTHGTTNQIIGIVEGGTTHRFTEDTFFGPLREAKEAGEPVWIRAVYQMNCNSGTLIDEWQSLGATTVAGTKLGDVSNYMPQQYIPFVNHWLADDTFQAATANAYQEARFVSADFYQVISQEEELMEHSELAVAGTATTRVTQ